MQAPICYLLHDYSIASTDLLSIARLFHCMLFARSILFVGLRKISSKRTALMEASLHVAMADWSTSQLDLSQRIIDAGSEDCLAIFNFGVIEGVMTFDSNQPCLFERASMEEDEEEEDMGAMNDEENESEAETRRGFRYDTNKLKATADSTPPPAKCPKPSSTAPSRRLHFHWRGRNTGEGEIAFIQ